MDREDHVDVPLGQIVIEMGVGDADLLLSDGLRERSNRWIAVDRRLVERELAGLQIQTAGGQHRNGLLRQRPTIGCPGDVPGSDQRVLLDDLLHLSSLVVRQAFL
jgi:hypothetical protein